MPNTTTPATPTIDRARIRRLRIEAGMTVSMLAARANTTQPTISGIETGRRRPSPPMLKRIASALGVMPADLLLPEAAGAHD